MYIVVKNLKTNEKKIFDTLEEAEKYAETLDEVEIEIIEEQ
ncbi:MAG: hypothetical protein QXO15_10425 [Nitrososphaerota archaeon]